MTDTAHQPAEHQVSGFYPWSPPSGPSPLEDWGPQAAPQPSGGHPLTRFREHLHPELNALLERLIALEQGRQALLDHLWATIPSVVNEAANNVNNPTSTFVDVLPTTSELWTCDVAVCTIPSGATGVLQLGQLVVPVGAGITTLAPLGWLMTQSSIRHLSSTLAGPISLSLIGQLRPTRGTMH